MDKDTGEKLNNSNDKIEGLSQEKFADLFSRLNEAYINDMLERAGLSEDDVEEPTAEPAPAEEEGAAETPAEPEEPEGEAVTETIPPVAMAGGNLEPEHIGHILKVLGEDMISDMLADAGLADEDESEELPPAVDPSPEDSDKKAETGKPEKKIKRRRKGKRTRRFLLLAIFAGILLLVFAVNQISMNVTLNSNDPIQYSEETDEISALEGALIVNNVNVPVPTDGTETYSISYSWSEEDEKYPSVPEAITAVYSDKEGTKLYTISLYRSETVGKKALPKGKNADNWFDNWETVSEGDVLQNPLKSGDINGFYIYPQMNEDGSAPSSDYNDYSYYFAVKKKSGISVYILEGVCYDENSAAVFPGIMDSCIKGIKIK